MQRIVRFLAAQDYVGGTVRERSPRPAARLRMSDVGLMGGATMPKPAVVVNFKSFALDSKNPHMTDVVVGSVRQHGQGDHGTLARANTFNNMAAIGPDFKRRFVSQSPVGNADVQPTLAHVMKMKIPSLGALRGRAITEALVGGPAAARVVREVARSRPASEWVFDRAGVPGSSIAGCISMKRASRRTRTSGATDVRCTRCGIRRRLRH